MPDGTHIVFSRRQGATKVVLMADGADVSRLVIQRFVLRFGRAVVRMDGIGGVETDEPYRNRGYARRVLDAAIDAMRRGDAALSMLYGIAHFYPKFGYATAGPNSEVWIDADSGKRLSAGGFEVRAATLEDLPALRGMYDRTTAAAVGAVVRTADDPVWFAMAEDCGNRGELRVVAAASGEPVGYLWKGKRFWMQRHFTTQYPATLVIAEAMATSPAAADAVLAAGARWAGEPDALATGAAEKACLVLPHDHPVALAATHRDASHTRRYLEEAEFMARTIDVTRLLRSLLPEISQRLATTRADWPASLRLRTDEGDVTLGLDPVGGQVRLLDASSTAAAVVVLPQHALARLALGAMDPADLLDRLPTPPDAKAREAILALFPLRQPHLYTPDRF